MGPLMGLRESLATCWEILPKVSRSFALPIRLLPRPTGDAVMLCYLIFRIADTIEDGCADPAERTRLFGAFRSLLDGDRSLASRLATVDPPPYDALMHRTGAVAEAFGTLPPSVRALVTGRLAEMSEGMQAWAAREVRTMDDLHDYCYYVAGIVGKLLTRIFREYGHIGEATFRDLDRRSVEFGLALQMVNVIRDVRADDREGRRYWPTQLLVRHGLAWDTLFRESHRARALAAVRDLVGDALGYCDVAIDYIRRLPAHQMRLRAFCALPLFMAVATMGACLGNPALFSDGRSVKIPRSRTRRILALSIASAPFDGLLTGGYRRLRDLGSSALLAPAPFLPISSP